MFEGCYLHPSRRELPANKTKSKSWLDQNKNINNLQLGYIMSYADSLQF
jgi:hypothetical protein